MDILTCIVVILIIYGVLYFFDVFFKTCAHYPYLQFLKGTGFEIKFLQVRWATTVFNRWFVRIGTGNSKFWTIWFTFGLYSVLLLLPISVILLLVSVGQSFLAQKTADGSQPAQILDTIIPGIDFPASELGYYGIALLICSILHEAGHALAAVKEDVHLNNVGVSVFFIFPVAYVNISTERLSQISPWRALKIVCAGVWHNIIIAGIAYLLFIGAPSAFSTFFDIGKGITVTHMTKTSPLKGSRGLNVMDVIQNINNCEILDEDAWYDCLRLLAHDKPELCVHADLIHTLDESIPLKLMPSGVYDCCGPEKPKHLCFEYIDRNNGVLAIPPHVCLPGRTIMEKSTQNCDVNYNCPHELHCIRPMFDNFTNLFKVKRKNDEDVIYIGHSSDFSRSLKVSGFIPNRVFSTTDFPDIVCKLLKYLVVFSLSLALMNVIPCLFLDGEHIVKYLTHIVIGRDKSSVQTANTVSLVTCLCGTVILVFYCLYSVLHKIFM